MYDFFEFAQSDGERPINSRIYLRERQGRVEVFKDDELYAVFAGSDREFRKAVMKDKEKAKENLGSIMSGRAEAPGQQDETLDDESNSIAILIRQSAVIWLVQGQY